MPMGRDARLPSLSPIVTGSVGFEWEIWGGSRPRHGFSGEANAKALG